MNEAKHSPAPWTNDPDTGVTFDANGEPLRTAGQHCITDKTGEYRGNAWLIAAAPDLLAALKVLRDCIDRVGEWEDGEFLVDGMYQPPLQGAMEHASRMIAKVEGKEATL
jgi:hypothetical protein